MLKSNVDLNDLLFLKQTRIEEFPRPISWAAANENYVEKAAGQIVESRNPLGFRQSSDRRPKMATPTREELDAKLALAESRAETRFVELNGKLDRIESAIAGS
jgi:hypothetical protein